MPENSYKKAQEDSTMRLSSAPTSTPLIETLPTNHWSVPATTLPTPTTSHLNATSKLKETDAMLICALAQILATTPRSMLTMKWSDLSSLLSHLLLVDAVCFAQSASAAVVTMASKLSWSGAQSKNVWSPKCKQQRDPQPRESKSHQRATLTVATCPAASENSNDNYFQIKFYTYYRKGNISDFFH